MDCRRNNTGGGALKLTVSLELVDCLVLEIYCSHVTTPCDSTSADDTITEDIIAFVLPKNSLWPTIRMRLPKGFISRVFAV